MNGESVIKAEKWSERNFVYEVMVLSLAQGQKERRENLLSVIALIWSDYRRGPILFFDARVTLSHSLSGHQPEGLGEVENGSCGCDSRLLPGE